MKEGLALIVLTVVPLGIGLIGGFVDGRKVFSGFLDNVKWSFDWLARSYLIGAGCVILAARLLDKEYVDPVAKFLAGPFSSLPFAFAAILVLGLLCALAGMGLGFSARFIWDRMISSATTPEQAADPSSGPGG